MFQQGNMKKNGFNGYIYDFSVDYDAINVDDILDIHKYVMKKKWNSIKMFRFVKRIFVSAMMFSGCNLLRVNSLECVSMNNQVCQVRPEIFNVNSNEPIFFLLVLEQVNAVVVVIISMIPIQNCVFLILLKIWMSKFLI